MITETGEDPFFIESTDTVSTQGPNCIVRDVLQDKNGNLWFATWKGIIMYDGRVFTNYTLKYGLIHFHVFALFQDSKNKLWFSVARGGVYRFDGKSFQLFTMKNGLPDNTITSFAEDKNGNIWFGTENGLGVFNGKTFSSFTTENGLFDNVISSLLFDKSGVLWIGSAKCLCRYDGKTFSLFNDNEGMLFFRVASLFEYNSRNIWIGSSHPQAGGKGLCRYDGKSLTELVVPNFIMYLRQTKKGDFLMAFNNFPAKENFSMFRYNGKTLTEIYAETQPEINPAIFGMIEDNNVNIWFGTARGICCYNGKTFNYFQ